MFCICLTEAKSEHRDELERQLVAAGYKVKLFSEPKSLYLSLLHASCDIVFIDAALLAAEDPEAVPVLHQLIPAVGIVSTVEAGCLEAKLRMLELGCDACLERPLNNRELLAVLSGLLRRLRPGMLPGSPAAVDDGAAWHLAEDGWALRGPEGQGVDLTSLERLFMQRLLADSGLVVSRDALVRALGEDVFDYDFHRLDALVSRLRRKVEEQGLSFPLRVVRGKGYLFLHRSERASD